MKYRLPISIVLALLCAAAQGQMADLSTSRTSQISSPFDSPNQHVTFLMGRVVAEDGAEVGASVTLVLECGSQAQARTHSDSKGNFSLALAMADDGSQGNPFGARTGPAAPLSLTNCELHGELSGYRSEYIKLSGGPGVGIVQVGAVTLHPLVPERSFSVSATSLAAPEKAKKSLQKGREQAEKGKWAAAAGYFKRAIEEYPRYALAWVELGRTQVQENSFTEAQQSFQQSVEQDSKFLDGYVGLAYLALQQQQWKELADTTERILEISPDSAEFWFLNAVATFNLGDTKQAETSVGRGLRLDPKHQIPAMEYLYGLILARRHEYGSAIEHISDYLRLAPSATNAQDARKALAEFQQQEQHSVSASR